MVKTVHALEVLRASLELSSRPAEVVAFAFTADELNLAQPTTSRANCSGAQGPEIVIFKGQCGSSSVRGPAAVKEKGLSNPWLQS